MENSSSRPIPRALFVSAPGAKVEKLAGDFEFTEGPTCDAKGNLFFTDPFYKRAWWKHDTMPQDGQHVYFLSADRRELVRVADDLKQPNGIIGTPDGKTLYVADIGAGKTYRFGIASVGHLTGKMLVCGQGSDGMTLDNEGNLYLTGKGVLVIDKAGRQIQRI